MLVPLLLLCSASTSAASCEGYDCLKQYVDKDDGFYKYEDTGYQFTGVTKHGLYTAFFLNVTSQKWLSEEVLNRPVWWHILMVILPEKVKYPDTGFVWVTGDSNEGTYNTTSGAGFPTPTDEDVLVAASVATATGTIGSSLFQIPNAQIVFKADPTQKRRGEDAIIAWTWASFCNPRSPAEAAAHDELPLRLPMTKAVVKAMDAMTDFTRKKMGGTGVTQFGVAGASKRGWTTWTTAAVDKRVFAAMPVVMDELNFLPNIHHHYEAYGGWSFALTDYYDLNFTQNLDTPEAEALFKIVDPYWYPPETLAMPKLVINSGMDEFFLPDDTRFWWQNMTGPKHFLMIPNAEHSEATGILEILPAVSTFLEASIPVGSRSHLAAEDTIVSTPEFTQEISADGTSITVVMDKNNAVPPHEVTMWHATTCDSKRRDFRIVNKYTNVNESCAPCGQQVAGLPFGATCTNLKILWSKTVLSEDAPNTGRYIARRTAETDGRWTAFFIDVTFDSKAISSTTATATANDEQDYGWPIGHDGYFEFTSEVSIIPQTFPFPPCKGDACRGQLL